LFSPEGKSGTKKLGKVGISQIGQGDGEKVELVFFKWNEGEGSCKHIPNGSTDGFCVELTEAAGTTRKASCRALRPIVGAPRKVSCGAPW
jgi:hypothetical protein